MPVSDAQTSGLAARRIVSLIAEVGSRSSKRLEVEDSMDLISGTCLKHVDHWIPWMVGGVVVVNASLKFVTESNNDALQAHCRCE